MRTEAAEPGARLCENPVFLYKMWHNLLGKQAQRLRHLRIGESANIHIGQKVGHVPGLQVLQGGRDLCWCANRPHGLLPASLRQLRVDKWITGVVLIAAQSTRPGQGGD